MLPISAYFASETKYINRSMERYMGNKRNLRRANLKDEEIQKNVTYNDGELALVKNIHDINSILPCQLEVFVIVLVLEGKASVNINGTRYEALPNDLYIGTPNNIVENGMTSLDFKSYSICVSTDYIRRILPLADNSWDVKLLFEENPLCSLQPEEAWTFCQYFDLLCSKVQQPSPTQKKVMDALMLAFVYDMQGALNRVARHNPRPFTASETLFKRFIELLSSSYPKPRAVYYYADRLNVTPKYLSAVCRQAGGERASDLINLYVVKDIEYLMNHTQKSIKEIACELEFPNLSFFGKYVKKHFGLSPKAYRELSLEE